MYVHQSALYLGTRIVGMVEDTELGVSALTVQVEGAVFFAVEVDAPFYELLYLLRRHAHHLFHGLAVGDVVAGNHRVLDVLVEVVEFEVGHRGHTSLCKRCVRLVERGFTDHTHSALVGPCHFQGIAHACHAGTDHEKVIFVHHT